MADKDIKGLPEVQEPRVDESKVDEPKVGPERLVHEKAERGTDLKALWTLLGAGAICGTCMWVAFSFVGGAVDLEALFGAIVGGLLSGGAIYALT